MALDLEGQYDFVKAEIEVLRMGINQVLWYLFHAMAQIHVI